MHPVNDNFADGAPIGGSAFKLRRVFAQGWNAARKLSSEARDELNLRVVATFNPYANEPERSRWVEGFTKALDI